MTAVAVLEVVFVKIHLLLFDTVFFIVPSKVVTVFVHTRTRDRCDN